VKGAVQSADAAILVKETFQDAGLDRRRRVLLAPRHAGAVILVKEIDQSAGAAISVKETIQRDSQVPDLHLTQPR
jgi:hypothetical protein